jgi:hypothetical protein
MRDGLCHFLLTPAERLRPAVLANLSESIRESPELEASLPDLISSVG